MLTALLQRGNFPPPHEATCWLWVATPNALGWDPGDWAVHGLATIKVTWPTTLLIGLYWARRVVRETWSDQSAGHVSPLSDFWKNLNYRAMTVGLVMLRKDLYSFLSLGNYLGNENPGTKFNCLPSAWVYWLCSPNVTRRMGFPLGTSLCGAPWGGGEHNQWNS